VKWIQFNETNFKLQSRLRGNSDSIKGCKDRSLQIPLLNIAAPIILRSHILHQGLKVWRIIPILILSLTSILRARNSTMHAMMLANMTRHQVKWRQILLSWIVLHMKCKQIWAILMKPQMVVDIIRTMYQLLARGDW